MSPLFLSITKKRFIDLIRIIFLKLLGWCRANPPKDLKTTLLKWEKQHTFPMKSEVYVPASSKRAWWRSLNPWKGHLRHSKGSLGRTYNYMQWIWKWLHNTSIYWSLYNLQVLSSIYQVILDGNFSLVETKTLGILFPLVFSFWSPIHLFNLFQYSWLQKLRRPRQLLINTWTVSFSVSCLLFVSHRFHVRYIFTLHLP